MVTVRTAPPWVCGYGGTWVPPPAKLIRSGARAHEVLTLAPPTRSPSGSTGRSRGRLGQQLLEAVDDRLPGELGLDPAAPGRPHGPPPGPVGQQPGHGVGDRPGPAPVDHRSGLALHDRVGGAA